MTVILGLDIATTTGWAFCEDNGPHSAVRTGIIKAKGETPEEKYASLASQFRELFYRYEVLPGGKRRKILEKPDFVAIEQPMRSVKQFKKKSHRDLGGFVPEETTINPNAMQLSGMVGAVVGIIACYNIPWSTIEIQKWRKGFLGFGRRPGWERIDWKRAALARCAALNIEAKTYDAAEAVGIAMAAPGCDVYRMLKYKAQLAKADAA